jgi:dihydroorotate dehydrogenase
MSAKKRFIHLTYSKILKPIFFRFDAEDMHDFFTDVGKFLGKHSLTKKITGALFDYTNPKLEQDIFGIHFKNPIGLSAGFDKNAELTDILPAVGFGFIEVGSITGEPCIGNLRPRLWRLPKSQALVVNYGLKNDGCEKISQRLKQKKFAVPIGINIAKTNNPFFCTTELGIADYVKAYQAFVNIGNYDTINISCPNAQGGQPFTNPQSLDLLLSAIRKIPCEKPIFLKVPADSSDTDIDGIIEVAQKYKISGFVCTNLAKSRDGVKDKFIPEKGGLSGKIVEAKSNHIIEYIYKKTRGECIIIGVGGIFSASDAYKKIRLGASLIELITGMIYEGPQLIGEINEELVQLLQKDGFDNISEAIGIDAK